MIAERQVLRNKADMKWLPNEVPSFAFRSR